MLRFDLEIMGIRLWSYLYFLNQDDLLLLLGDLSLLALLILEFAKVHYSANRGIRVRSNLDQIQS